MVTPHSSKVSLIFGGKSLPAMTRHPTSEGADANNRWPNVTKDAEPPRTSTRGGRSGIWMSSIMTMPRETHVIFGVTSAAIVISVDRKMVAGWGVRLIGVVPKLSTVQPTRHRYAASNLIGPYYNIILGIISCCLSARKGCTATGKDGRKLQSPLHQRHQLQGTDRIRLSNPLYLQGSSPRRVLRCHPIRPP